MGRTIRVTLLVAGLCVIAAGVAGPASARVPNRVITVAPKSAMVGTGVTLTGTGFAPRTAITVQECGARNWVVPQQACVETNAVTVTTNRSGGFQVDMTAQVCPFFPGDGLAHPTERRCFVGVPRIDGVDTEHLTGAAVLIVSWP